jgi:hypothetical protein
MARLATRIAVALAGCVAGAAVTLPVHEAWPGLAPGGSFAVLAAIVALASGALALAWFERAKRDPARARRRLALAALVAGAIVLIFRPFQELPLDWRITGNREHGKPLRLKFEAETWGISPPHVAAFHASSDPNNPKLPFRHRVEADARPITAFGPARLRFRATQPPNAIIDPATNQRRPEINGVTGFVQALDPGHGNSWVPLGRLELEPTSYHWSEVDVDLPQGSKRVALSWDSRGDATRDYVLVAFEPPRAAPVLGVSRASLLRLGEFVLLTIAASLAGIAIRFILEAIGRLATYPEVRIAPTRFRVRPGLAVAVAVILIAPLGIAIPVAPWLEAATTPVIINWQAPGGSTLDVGFGEGPDDHVPAVRLDENRFGAEIPPRPTYRIVLQLRSESASLPPPPGDVSLIDPRSRAAAVTIKPGELKLIGEAGTQNAAESRPRVSIVRTVTYPHDVSVGTRSRWSKIGAVWLGGAAALALAFASLVFLSRRATTRDEPVGPVPGPVLPLAISAAVVLAVAVVWTLSRPAMASDDTINYLWKGEALATAGTTESGLDGGELTRTPGFPAFLGVVLKFFGRSYTAIAVAQGVLHACALFFAALSLRKFVRTPWLVAGILVGGTFLPHLYFASMMISESTFTSFSLVALGCFWFARGAATPVRHAAWMAGFAVAASVAAFTRLVGVALLAVPAITWLSGTIALWKAGPAPRVANVLRHTAPYAFALVIVLASILAWCLRNHAARGYFGFAAMVSLSNLQGEVHAGMLDPRVFVQRGLYERYVRERDVEHYMWSVWKIFGPVFEKAEADVRAGGSLTTRAEEIYEEMYRASNAPLPLPARLVKFIRSAWWNLGLSSEHDYVGALKVANDEYWRWTMTFEDARHKQLEVDGITGIPMHVTSRPVSRITEGFQWIGPWYSRIHAVLLLAAIGCGLLVLWAGNHGLAAPIAFVAANFVILTMTRQHETRYMVIMDVYCVLQIVLLLGGPRPNASAGPPIA